MCAPSWEYDRCDRRSLIIEKIKRPIEVIIEPDENGYICAQPFLNLYGIGGSKEEAVGMLRREIESLYDDLMKDDDFSDDWIRIKHFLLSEIASDE